jgi:hypothetical protein
MKVEVQKYRKPDGYATRYWSVTVDGELLAVTVYRKGAMAVANAITNRDPYVTTIQDSAQSDYPRKPAATRVEASNAR